MALKVHSGVEQQMHVDVVEAMNFAADFAGHSNLTLFFQQREQLTATERGDCRTGLRPVAATAELQPA